MGLFIRRESLRLGGENSCAGAILGAGLPRSSLLAPEGPEPSNVAGDNGYCRLLKGSPVNLPTLAMFRGLFAAIASLWFWLISSWLIARAFSISSCVGSPAWIFRRMSRPRSGLERSLHILVRSSSNSRLQKSGSGQSSSDV